MALQCRTLLEESRRQVSRRIRCEDARGLSRRLHLHVRWLTDNVLLSQAHPFKVLLSKVRSQHAWPTFPPANFVFQLAYVRSPSAHKPLPELDAEMFLSVAHPRGELLQRLLESGARSVRVRGGGR